MSISNLLVVNYGSFNSSTNGTVTIDVVDTLFGMNAEAFASELCIIAAVVGAFKPAIPLWLSVSVILLSIARIHSVTIGTILSSIDGYNMMSTGTCSIYSSDADQIVNVIHELFFFIYSEYATIKLLQIVEQSISLNRKTIFMLKNQLIVAVISLASIVLSISALPQVNNACVDDVENCVTTTWGDILYYSAILGGRLYVAVMSVFVIRKVLNMERHQGGVKLVLTTLVPLIVQSTFQILSKVLEFANDFLPTSDCESDSGYYSTSDDFRVYGPAYALQFLAIMLLMLTLSQLPNHAIAKSESQAPRQVSPTKDTQKINTASSIPTVPTTPKNNQKPESNYKESVNDTLTTTDLQTK